MHSRVGILGGKIIWEVKHKIKSPEIIVDIHKMMFMLEISKKSECQFAFHS